MRFLLYNIAYGTGAPRSMSHHVLGMPRYLLSSRHHFARIREFIVGLSPDIVGLVEVDRGSYRTNRLSQVQDLSRALSHVDHFSSKYGHRSLLRYLPLARHQGNALLARRAFASCRSHFFNVGVKRLVLEGHVFGVTVFLVHLALRKRARLRQCGLLAELVGRPAGPVIVAGDFNAFSGRAELAELMRRTGLCWGSPHVMPTYPSWSPQYELDFILCSRDIRVNACTVMHDACFSDHLPLLLDFSVSGE